MVRSRRESHHSDGITDPNNLQQISATKSATSGHCYARHITGQAFDRPRQLCGVSTILKAILEFLGVDMPGYFDLSERVALVTGASRGLGLAMAEALAEAGATVVLNGRDANTLKAAADRIRDRGLNAETSAFDVTDRRAADSAIRSVVTRHQRLDILIANAGITRRGQLAEWTSEAWDAVLAANLSACFFLAQSVAAPMRSQGYGRIIFTTSVVSRRPGVNLLSLDDLMMTLKERDGQDFGSFEFSRYWRRRKIRQGSDQLADAPLRQGNTPCTIK